MYRGKINNTMNKNNITYVIYKNKIMYIMCVLHVSVQRVASTQTAKCNGDYGL